MTRTLSVWVGAEIIYLYGTVNGEAATFTLVGGGMWQAIVPRSEDDNYLLHLEAYSENGLEGVYDYVLYYGLMPFVTDRNGGYYKHTDLKRVSHNARHLAGLLNGYGYAVTVNPKTDWAVGDIPRDSEMVRYLGDVQSVKTAFYGTTPLPESMERIDYRDANNIEKLLEEIETYINRMVAGFRKCGTFRAGQGVILPRKTQWFNFQIVTN
jgi:hypothetical protein